MSSTTTPQLLIPASTAKALPAMVRNELSQSAPKDQEAFLEEYRRQVKSTGVAYLLFLCFGCHYAYLGRWGLQVAFWFTFGGAGIWALVDLFRLPGLLESHNRDKATDVMRNLKLIGG